LTSVELFVVVVIASVEAVIIQVVNGGVEDIVTVVVAESVVTVEDNGRFRDRSVRDGRGVVVVEEEVLGNSGGHVNEWEGGVEELFEGRG
jgi:hypothetical protein